MTKTAKDFTMAAEGADIYQNPAWAFDWIMEGASPEALETVQEQGGTIEEFVRNYAKSIIEIWKSNEQARASVATIYKTWRAGDEFELIVRYIRENYYN